MKFTSLPLLSVSTIEPKQVVPLTDAHNDSHVTIKWSHSSNYLVARYIVDVREYIAGVKGKVEAQSVNGYPREISAIQLNHTVESLSM